MQNIPLKKNSMGAEVVEATHCTQCNPSTWKPHTGGRGGREDYTQILPLSNFFFPLRYSPWFCLG